MHLEELISKRVLKISEEYKRLLESFTQVKIYNQSLSRYITEEFYMNFPFAVRNTFVSVEDMFKHLNLNYRVYTVKLDELVLLCETILTIFLHCGNLYYYNDLKNNICESIDHIVESINCTVITNDNFVRIIEKDKAVTEAIEYIDNEDIAVEFLEYNRVLLNGNLKEKKKILSQLWNFIEPMLDSKVLSSNGYKQLESDVRFYCNNLNIRHNNLEGTKQQQIFIDIDKQGELEIWYDKAYNTILMCIIANKQIVYRDELKVLKANYGM